MEFFRVGLSFLGCILTAKDSSPMERTEDQFGCVHMSQRNLKDDRGLSNACWKNTDSRIGAKHWIKLGELSSYASLKQEPDCRL